MLQHIPNSAGLFTESHKHLALRNSQGSNFQDIKNISELFLSHSYWFKLIHITVRSNIVSYINLPFSIHPSFSVLNCILYIPRSYSSFSAAAVRIFTFLLDLPVLYFSYKILCYIFVLSICCPVFSSHLLTIRIDFVRLLYPQVLYLLSFFFLNTWFLIISLLFFPSILLRNLVSIPVNLLFCFCVVIQDSHA